VSDFGELAERLNNRDGLLFDSVETKENDDDDEDE
jgi:hypothetical protein